MRIGFYLPIIQYIGGAEKIAFLLAKRFNGKIYTSYFRKDINNYLPGIKNYIVDISRKKKNRPPSLISVIKDYMLFKPNENIIVYCNPHTIFLHLFHPSKKYAMYITSIPHYLYLEKEIHEKYFGKMGKLKEFDRLIWRFFMRNLIRPKNVICISKTTAENLKKIAPFLQTKVIYPPMDLCDFKEGNFEDYYLSVTRFVPYKRVDWQIDAFKRSHEKLVIVGNGPLAEEYKKIIKDFPDRKSVV